MIRTSPALLTAAASLAVPGVASAASTVDIYSASLASDTENLGTYSVNAHDVANLVDFDMDIKSRATWTRPAVQAKSLNLRSSPSSRSGSWTRCSV